MEPLIFLAGWLFGIMAGLCIKREAVLENATEEALFSAILKRRICKVREDIAKNDLTNKINEAMRQVHS